jgi:hypothetical protein
MQSEVEFLQSCVSPDHPTLTLADGGEMATDLPKVSPDLDWGTVWADCFLEP